MATAPLYTVNLEGGIDFNRIDYSTLAGDSEAKFPVGSKRWINKVRLDGTLNLRQP